MHIDTQSVHIGPFTPDFLPELPWSPTFRRRYRYWVVGRLPTTSGHIAADDIIGRPLPFKRRIPCGNYPTWVVQERSRNRIAFVGIEFRQGLPV